MPILLKELDAFVVEEDISNYGSHHRRKLESVARAARCHKNSFIFRIEPVDNEILCPCHCVKALLNLFNPLKSFSEKLNSFFDH